jgi:hypothetical protein
MTKFQTKIKDRLAQTLIRLRLAKLRQIVERTGHPLEDILFIKKLELGWRIGPIRPSPVKPREVAAITRAVRAVHYRGIQIYDNSDDGSEYRFGREVAEYLDIEGYARRRIEQKARKILKIPREAG